MWHNECHVTCLTLSLQAQIKKNLTIASAFFLEGKFTEQWDYSLPKRIEYLDAGEDICTGAKSIIKVDKIGKFCHKKRNLYYRNNLLKYFPKCVSPIKYSYIIYTHISFTSVILKVWHSLISEFLHYCFIIFVQYHITWLPVSDNIILLS